jgi:hypothetical protein
LTKTSLQLKTWMAVILIALYMFSFSNREDISVNAYSAFVRVSLARPLDYLKTGRVTKNALETNCKT